jgi:hypothetical protein
VSHGVDLQQCSSAFRSRELTTIAAIYARVRDLTAPVTPAFGDQARRALEILAAKLAGMSVLKKKRRPDSPAGEESCAGSRA